MLSILGPAKTIDSSPHGVTSLHSDPAFLDQGEVLMALLKKYSLGRLKTLMKVSDSLASQTVEGIARWHRTPTEEEGIQAMLAFSGEVFRGLQARSLSEEDLRFAQDHVRILSGLYGVLRPLDRIMPYRLEMGTALKPPQGKNLYEYWSKVIPPAMVAETEASHASQEGLPTLINLASNEYFKSIRPADFPHRIISPAFKESDGDGFRNVTVYAKKARGLMLRFIIRHRITDPEYLKAFDEEGYAFHPHLSTDSEWVFTR